MVEYGLLVMSRSFPPGESPRRVTWHKKSHSFSIHPLIGDGIILDGEVPDLLAMGDGVIELGRSRQSVARSLRIIRHVFAPDGKALLLLDVYWPEDDREGRDLLEGAEEFWAELSENLVLFGFEMINDGERP